MPSDEGALRGRGCLVIDRQGRVLLGCGCGHADTALFPRRLVRLILALRELSGSAVLTQLEVGACKVRAVACSCFTVVLVPHAGAGDVCDVEALHIAHMLQMLYPAELGAGKRKGAEGACDKCPAEEEYSAQQELRSDIDDDLDKDAQSDTRFLAFQHSYLEPVLSRPPASINWLSPLAACPGVVHASIVAHVISEQSEAAAGAGMMAEAESDLMVLSCPGLSEDTAALAQVVHSSICSQALGGMSATAARNPHLADFRSVWGGHGGGTRLWEWMARWSRIANQCNGEGRGGGSAAHQNSEANAAGGAAVRSFRLPVNSAARAFGSELSVLVSPTGRRACGTLALSLVLVIRDSSRVSCDNAGWGGGVVAPEAQGSASQGRGLVAQGCGKEEGLVIVSLPERMVECTCATVEALDIAFPSDVPPAHTSATTHSTRPSAPSDAQTLCHPPAGPPTQGREALVPVPPKRQRPTSAGPRRPPSQGRPGADALSKSVLVEGQSHLGGGDARSGGTDTERGQEGDRLVHRGGEPAEARSAHQIFSLSRPLTDSSVSGQGGKRPADWEEDGRELDEPFGPEVGGHASRLRSQLGSSNRDASASGMVASGSRSGAGATRSENLRSSKLYTDLGFATPRKLEPASDTNPFRLVDLYQGTPDKGAAGGGGLGRVPDDENEQPLSLDMLEGGGGGDLAVMRGAGGNNRAATGRMEGVAEEVVPSPATNLSSTLDDMAL